MAAALAAWAVLSARALNARARTPRSRGRPLRPRARRDRGQVSRSACTTSARSPGIPPARPISSRGWRAPRSSPVARRGKFLWMPLAGGAAEERSAIVCHLGMSGQLLLRRPDAPAERHERIRLFIEHPQHGELAVVFADQRTFGSLAVDALVPTARRACQPGGGAPSRSSPHRSCTSHGIRWTRRSRITLPHRAACAVERDQARLLDQTLISGVGNIYADESLWAAGIHPETPTSALSPWP